MHALTAAYFAAHPELSLAALGPAANAAALDLAPFGHAARYFPAERHADLCARYHAANHAAFSSPAAPPSWTLPGWVLSDLFLLPGAIGLLLREDAIAASYVAVPSVVPGMFIGVSMISAAPGLGAGAWIKALTLRMFGARRMRGVAQWGNPSVRSHTRLGPLRLVGAVPGAHELGARSFVYESDLGDEGALAAAMERRISPAPTRRIPNDDLPALSALLARAEAGEVIHIVAPGLTETGEVLIHEAR